MLPLPVVPTLSESGGSLSNTLLTPTRSVEFNGSPIDAETRSRALAARIEAELRAGDNWMSFARYMEMALYEPGLGYYAAGSAKLGAGGDFVTAPELTPLFGRALARQIAGPAIDVLGRHRHAQQAIDRGNDDGRNAVRRPGALPRRAILRRGPLFLMVPRALRKP